jgi:ribonuclease HII
LGRTPREVLVDGLHCPSISIRSRAVVGGDCTISEISAASILAKTARDAVMVELHVKHPAYGFDRHKGYATQAHLDALRAHGACIVHRRSFAPVRLALDQLCLWEQGASAST